MSKLSHFDAEGKPRMVDISGKQSTARVAIAEGYIRMRPATLAMIRGKEHEKGDVIGIAQLAGIMAAKRTHELIPLCHPLALSHIKVDLLPSDDRLTIRAECRLEGRTGVEMEALTAVSVAALTVYDMVKAADKSMEIGGVKLIEKSGGRSGHYRADD